MITSSFDKQNKEFEVFYTGDSLGKIKALGPYDLNQLEGEGYPKDLIRNFKESDSGIMILDTGVKENVLPDSSIKRGVLRGMFESFRSKSIDIFPDHYFDSNSADDFFYMAFKKIVFIETIPDNFPQNQFVLKIHHSLPYPMSYYPDDKYTASRLNVENSRIMRFAESLGYREVARKPKIDSSILSFMLRG